MEGKQNRHTHTNTHSERGRQRNKTKGKEMEQQHWHRWVLMCTYGILCWCIFVLCVNNATFNVAFTFDRFSLSPLSSISNGNTEKLLMNANFLSPIDSAAKSIAIRMNWCKREERMLTLSTFIMYRFRWNWHRNYIQYLFNRSAPPHDMLCRLFHPHFIHFRCSCANLGLCVLIHTYIEII